MTMVAVGAATPESVSQRSTVSPISRWARITTAARTQTDRVPIGNTGTARRRIPCFSGERRVRRAFDGRTQDGCRSAIGWIRCKGAFEDPHARRKRDAKPSAMARLMTAVMTRHSVSETSEDLRVCSST
jgi:hypothetical protein